ncbi:MAG: DNA repair protein RecO [Burkholderiaceae bacterium]|jgi:DNA repair protein RecO (recombination protein O)
MSDLQPAYVLHAIPYKETSLIAELWTRDYGRLPALVRGAKRPHSALRSSLLAFQPLLVKFSGKGEVKNLTGCEWAGGHLPPEGRALFSAYYINELLMQCVQREDAQPDLFHLYANTIAKLASHADIATTVRTFEFGLLQTMGFGVNFSTDANNEPLLEGTVYRWVEYEGWRRVVGTAMPMAAEPVYHGECLRRFQSNAALDEAAAQQLKPLTRYLLRDYLQDSKLLSRIWMKELNRS